MKILKVLGFLSPVAKNKSSSELKKAFGQHIVKGTKLFEILERILIRSEKECDIQIRFIAQNKKQDNQVRDEIIKITDDFTLKNCKPLVRSLSLLTDYKTKEGLVFFAKAEIGNNTRTFLARFPAEVGITITQKNGVKQFDVAEDVFIKNSRRYKAVYYDSTDQYWVGYAVDRQVNDSAGKIKEISDYWIKDFLKSELKMNSKRGSRILAKAIRKTIDETNDEIAKSELIGITSTIKNIANQKVSINSILKILNLSDNTKKEVKSKVENQKLNNIAFSFDIEEFQQNFSYLVNILDTGAVIIAPAKEFSEIWKKESIDTERYRYSTEGHPIKEKVSNRRI